LGLRNQHAIEWVTVQRRKGSCPLAVKEGDG
jgi:hypothetical protein